MSTISFVSSIYYSTFYYTFFLIISWATVLYYIGSNNQKLLRAEGSAPIQGVAIALTIATAIFIGLRPKARDFGDSYFYAHTFEYLESYEPVSFNTEWIWNNLMFFIKQMGWTFTEFFFVVAVVYYGGMLISAMLLTRNNLWMTMLFFFTSFSTYSFATNGLRNGMACSILLISIAIFARKDGYKNPLVYFFMFLAMGTHRSSLLPIAAAFASAFVIKDTKWTLRFWVASIAISLVAGPQVEQFFASLGFDDRMDRYVGGQYDEKTQAQFSHMGFRWDFLFYSCFPVLLTWYVTRVRKFKDKTFHILATTYILANAFWIMVIRSSFSNRFAYLSWFLYPLVMAYPLLRMNIWKDQDRKTAIILFLYSAFTFFMFYIFYFGQSAMGFNGFDYDWWNR